MSSRSYLSIGDVLTLLRQEFPDVTISKIRFLESQGLVNPERTPSGYRKFYEQDVERLRWVLRQQRENFLPLKVIKDRLDDDANGSASSDHEAPPPSRENAVAAHAGAPADTHRTGEPVLVGQRSSMAGRTAGSIETGMAIDPPTSAPGDGPTLPGIEPGTHAVSAPGALRVTTTPSQVVMSPSSGASAAAPTVHARSSEHPSPRDAATGGTAGRKSRTRRGAATPAGTQPPPASAGPPAGTQPPPASARSGSAVGRRAATAPADLNGASMSLDELSAACGLGTESLLELQEYGLLTATTVAGQHFFDEEALIVANLAARFARFGIEPRHLRLYKNAADREAGFVEQIVIPLVRQRNPDARARANDTADELAGLGQQLRGSLLRTALSSLLNG